MVETHDAERIERIAREVVDACIKVHKALGPGLLESVYVRVLARELERRGFGVHREYPVGVVWEGEDLGVGYRVDLLVDELVVLEIKSAEGNPKAYAKQALTYLRLLKLPLAFVLNFSHALMKDGIERVANNYFGGK